MIICVTLCPFNPQKRTLWYLMELFGIPNIIKNVILLQNNPNTIVQCIGSSEEGIFVNVNITKNDG